MLRGRSHLPASPSAWVSDGDMGLDASQCKGGPGLLSWGPDGAHRGNVWGGGYHWPDFLLHVTQRHLYRVDNGSSWTGFENIFISAPFRQKLG